MTKKHTIMLTITLLCLIAQNKCSEDSKDNIDINELQDRSHFKDYSLLKQFHIYDMEPEKKSYYYFYYFNMLAKSNLDPDNTTMKENEFYFDMYYYDRSYPTDPVAQTVDWTEKDLTNPVSAKIQSKIISAFKINSDFYKAEINIPTNSCLTLFFFLDSEETTDYKLYPSRHDVYFDMRKSRANNFSDAVDSFYGHANESFDLIYNDLEFSGDLYLKVVCPYYSNFGNDDIDFNVTLIPHGYDFQGKIILTEF
jgi:hypothetical protein